MPDEITIDRIPWDATAFARYRAARRPVVIEGVARRCPELDRWRLDHLAAQIGDRQVLVSTGHGPPAVTDPVRFLTARRYERRTFSSYAGHLAAGEVPPGGAYLTDPTILDEIPALRRDIAAAHAQLAALCDRDPRAWRLLSRRPTLWIGPAGVVSPLHFDRVENFHAQLTGHKRWTLFAPSQARSLYHRSREVPVPLYSPIDVERPDLARFPRYRDAAPWSAVVEAGEMLFVPSGWWHQVRTLDRSVSITFWFWSWAACVLTGRVALEAVVDRLRGARTGLPQAAQP